VTYDDAKWLLRVTGDAEEVSQARYFVKIVDVPHPTIKLLMHVDSPADRFGYDVTASLRSGQKWSLAEDATGLTVGLSPRLNDDSTCTIVCRISSEGAHMETTFRIRPGVVQVLDLGARRMDTVLDGAPRKAYTSNVPLPRISFSFQVEKPRPYRREK
jgi:hypothetical protein